MLAIPSRDVTSTKCNADGVQVKRFVRAVPVNFKPETRKTVKETRAAVSALYGSSSCFPDPLGNVPSVQDEITNKGGPWGPLQFNVEERP